MLRWINVIVTAVFFMHSPGLAHDVLRFQQAVEDAAGDGLAKARKGGKNALIARYRGIMEKYPGAEANLQIECMIANVHIWDLPERNEPSDMAGAFDVCAQAIARYDRTNPHMKEMLTLAASCSSDIEPDKSRQLYQRLLEDYPDDDVLKLHCYWGLGLNAAKRHQREEAEKCYSAVLKYNPAEQSPSKQLSAVQVHQRNAALGLFWAAADVSPELRYSAVQNVISRYPQIGLWHSDIVNPLLEEWKSSKADKTIAGVVSNVSSVSEETTPAASASVDQVATSASERAAHGGAMPPRTN